MSWICVACLLFAPLLAGDARATEVRVELQGPLERVVFDVGAAGQTELVLRLRPGERRSLDVPLPLIMPFGTEGQPIPAVELVTDGTGSVTIQGWAGGDPLAAQPAGLLRRPRPPAPESEGIPITAPLAVGLALVLAAALGLGVSSRRLGWVVCLLGSLGLGWWVAQLEPRIGSRMVWEVDLATGSGFSVESVGAVAHWTGSARLEVQPAGARLGILHDLSGAEPHLSAERMDGRAECVLLRPLEIRAGSALPERLGVDLEAVWARQGAEGWQELGPWMRGQPKPPATESAFLPPGWLLEGLPTGVTMIVGRTPAGVWVRAAS